MRSLRAGDGVAHEVHHDVLCGRGHRCRAADRGLRPHAPRGAPRLPMGHHANRWSVAFRCRNLASNDWLAGAAGHEVVREIVITQC